MRFARAEVSWSSYLYFVCFDLDWRSFISLDTDCSNVCISINILLLLREFSWCEYISVPYLLEDAIDWLKRADELEEEEDENEDPDVRDE